MTMTLVAVYFLCLGVLAAYGLHRYHVVYLYKKYKKAVPKARGQFDPLPHVTVQLPIYNERYVTRRLVDAVCALDYPRELLQVQVLDDSTDDTVDIARAVVEKHRAAGIDVEHVHRTDRSGFKAGALDEGLSRAKGELVAIFDADFLPRPELLREVVHHFTDPRVGMVQTRWGHINEDYSLLTRVQSILLDGHFVMEHTARNRSGRFFNFNGTAGIWRRSAIDDAGGWQHDTLTEDLDLSYRAQMRGWRFVFLNDVVTPGEVPVAMSAFKCQQHRWAKGSIQTCKKLLPSLWKAPLPFRVKLEGTVHLTSNFAYILILLMSTLMLPMAIFRSRLEPGLAPFLADTSLFALAFVSVCVFYMESQREIHADWRRRMRLLPMVLSVGIGMSLNNARAVLEAVLGRTSPFLRTPKYAVHAKDETWREKTYRAPVSLLPLLEILFALYFAGLVTFALVKGLWLMSLFLLLFLVGFGYVGALSLWELRRPPALALSE